MENYKLRGHEKFPLREGWLNKGLLGVNQDAKVFHGNEGADKLGVGTNMVKAIRYWMQAYQLIEESPRTGATLSGLGSVIRTYDAYFEDLFTLWLLHSQIAKNVKKATVWYLFFNHNPISEFTKDDIFELIRKELIAYAGTDKFSEASLKDDVDVLLNMYSKVSEDDDPEDKNRSPFAALGLLKKEGNTYVKQQPSLKKFSDSIILYEIFTAGEDSSVSIDKIAELAANIYNLSRVNVNTILDRIERREYIQVDRTAGLDMVYTEKKLKPIEVVVDYYNNR